MLLRWLTSAGILFESLQPLTFALAAVASTWVLANARRRGVHPYLTVAWALGAFFLPLVILPLYFAARAAAPPRETTHASPAEPDREQPTDTTAAPAVSGASATAASFDERRGTRSFAGRPAILIQSWAFPFLYAAVLCASGAAYFYLDYDSVDAGLARAERAKLTGRREAAIREYRAALRREEDAHTRKLLAVELAEAGRREEALAEFVAAERGGEPDARLPYLIAATLDALDRPAEAAPYYDKFLNGPLCTQAPPHPNCDAARARKAR